ncbi:MAG: D-alanyl-D-alanine carboxypeptidase [Desulfobacteraceae bacterium]|nr:MAG: D-alanyl-D-alanine carboxypeptidase [Desulfobacteraceae bacterium]
MKKYKPLNGCPLLSVLIIMMVSIITIAMGFDTCQAATPENIFQKLLGKNDSLLITDLHSNQNPVRIHPDKMLIPASILKLFTALVAINTLGENYHFHTEFYRDAHNNLKIKGYGDPLLVSEIIREIAIQLGREIADINDIVLDGTYFQSPLMIPGASQDSIQPYDAPNGSLCVNFNTVFFSQDHQGNYISAEPQTPLLPFVLERIKRSSIRQGRIILVDDRNENLLYAGHLFKHFLNSVVPVKGTIRQGTVDKKNDRIILRYQSPHSLQDIIGRMLYYSNNFTANQILIAAGAAKYGAPGTLEKGIQAAKAYAASHGLSRIQLQEGSGLSTGNRLSADMMGEILRLFFPYRHVLKQQGRDLFKTGTLTGIRSRAGYLQTKDGKLISYVVMLNSSRNSMEKIMDMIYRFY